MVVVGWGGAQVGELRQRAYCIKQVQSTHDAAQTNLAACAPKNQMSNCLLQFMWQRIDIEHICLQAAVQLSTCLNSAQNSLLYAVCVVALVASSNALERG
eukprot:4589748-Pleurochrysis_carterae.AAC.1